MKFDASRTRVLMSLLVCAGCDSSGGVPSDGGNDVVTEAAIDANGPDTNDGGTSGPPGTIDTSFGADGSTLWEASAYGARLAIAPDDKILIAMGSDPNVTNGTVAVRRFDATGKLDGAFAVGGTQTTQVKQSGDAFVGKLVVQSDAKVVLAGSAGPTFSTQEFYVARYLPTGALDGAFNAGGIFVAQIDVGDFVTAVALQTDGKILVGGSCTDTSAQAHACMFRLTSTGALDTTFGTSGVVEAPFFFAPPETVADIALQADGRILVAASSIVGNNRQYMAVRYTSSGSIDSTYASSGKTTFPFDSVNRCNDQPVTALLQSDGSLILTGEHSLPDVPSVELVGVAKLGATGALDNTFGQAGLVTTGPPEIVYGGSAIQQSGKLYIAASHSTPNRAWIGSITTTGTVNTAFGTQGFVKMADGSASGISTQSTGRLVVLVGSTTGFGLYRLWP